MLQACVHATSVALTVPFVAKEIGKQVCLCIILVACFAQELRGLIQDNPALRGKMEFPPIPSSALASVFAQL